MSVTQSNVAQTYDDRQMYHSYDLCLFQGAAKVSILMIGQQAIMDAYLCLIHLTAGILVGKNSDLSSTHLLFVSISRILAYLSSPCDKNLDSEVLGVHSHVE